MKKALSILLAAVLTLSCGMSAWAAEEPAGDRSHVVSDITFISDDQVIELDGVTIELDVTGQAGRLHVDQDGEPAAELGVTVLDDGLYVLHMDSPSLGHKDYGIDPAVILSRMLQSGIDSLTGLLQSIDADDAARKLLDSMRKDGADQAPEATEAPAPAMPKFTIEGDPMAVIEGCIGEPETVHMGGVEYAPDGSVAEMPDGDYQVQTFSFDTDALCQVLDMVYIDGEPAGLGDELRQSGTDFLFAGVYYDNDAAHIGQISCSLTGDDINVNAGVGYNQLITDDGKKTTCSFGLSSGADLETMSVTGLSFTVTDGAYEGESFAPADVDRDQLVMLTDMDTDQGLEELSQSLSVLLGDMLVPMLTPFAAVMTAMPDGEIAE